MEDWKPRILVLGPGGVKAISMIGFLHTASKSGLLDEVQIFCGVSAGSILALLTVIGYSCNNIINIALKTDLLGDFSSINIIEIFTGLGLLSNESLQNQISKLVKHKYGYVPTLKQLHDLTHKTYVSVAFNVTDNITEYISHMNYPEMSCVTAALLSINIPFLFKKITYRGKTYVDGALGNSFPIDHFDNNQENILGVYIRSGVDSNNPNKDNSDTINNYIIKVIMVTMEEKRNITINKSSKNCRSVGIPVNTFDTTGISLDKNDKLDMVKSGMKKAEEFIKEKRDSYTPLFTSFDYESWKNEK